MKDIKRFKEHKNQIHHKNYFFPQDEVKISSTSNILGILKEDEENNTNKCQCSEYLKKIEKLEDSLKTSRDAQNQV